MRALPNLPVRPLNVRGCQIWYRSYRLLVGLTGGLLLLLAACSGQSGDRVTAAEHGAIPASAASEFAAGSCKSFAPTSRGNGHTVFIDAGHGGPDPGASGTTEQGRAIDEETVTLAVALDLSSILRHSGYTVVLARTQDSSVAAIKPGDTVNGTYTYSGNHEDLLARIDCANLSKANVLVAIHFNSFSDPAVGGAETIYDGARSFAAKNEKLAQLIQQNVVSALHGAGWEVPDRGIAPDTTDDEPALTAQGASYPYLLELGPAKTGYLDSPTRMPGVISESLFLTDPFEASIAAGEHGQQVIAQGLAKGIGAFFAAEGRTLPGGS